MNKQGYMWNKLSQLGITGDLPMQSVKRITLVNRLSLVLAALSVISSCIFMYAGLYVQAGVLLSILPGALMVQLLNHYQRYLSARLLITPIINIVIFYFALTLSKECGMYLLFFYSAVVPWLFFSPKQAIYSVSGSALSFALFLYVIFASYVPAVALSAGMIHVFFAVASLVAFALLVFTMLLFRNDTNRTEQFLGSTNAILQETKRKLQHTLTENEAVVAFSQVMYSNSDSIETLCRAGLNKIKDIAPYTYGAILLYEKDTDTLHVQEEVGFDAGSRRAQQFRNGQSLTGDAFLRQKMIRIQDAPDNYWHATSGLGNVKPAELVIMPITFKTKAGVLELAFMIPPDDATMAILQRVSVAFAANILAFSANKQ